MNKIFLPKGYHNFADKRKMVGIPNAMNVLSNVFIIIPVLYLLKHKMTIENNNKRIVLADLEKQQFDLEESIINAINYS